jgi:hypothetical protein
MCLTVGGELVVHVGADALDGDTRVDTGVGCFLCLQGFERNHARRRFYPGPDRTPPGSGTEATVPPVWLPSKQGRVETSRLDRCSWAARRHIVPLIGAVRLED